MIPHVSGWWPRLIVSISGITGGRNNPGRLCPMETPPALIFIFSSWPLNPEQWASAAVAAEAGGGTMAVSDLQWEAADYAELQMDDW